MSALAEFPDRIKAIFKTQEVNSSGIYEMEFCIGGKMTSVTVDDFIPVTEDDKPAFCSTHDEELWAILLEKGFAKLHGNYDVMQGGKAGMALHILTGYPEMDYMHGNLSHLTETNQALDDLWHKMFAADTKGYTIGAGTAGAGEMDIDGSGIVSGHAYTMIGAYEVTDAQGNPERLVKLRNPWGQTEFKGSWNDEDEEHWTQELRDQLGCAKADDGIFFMPIIDYVKYFDHTCICMDVGENYKTKSLLYDGNKQEVDTQQVQFSLTLEEDVDCSALPIAIEVIQQGEKLNRYRKQPEPLQEAIPVVVLFDDKMKQIAKNVSPCMPIFSFSLISDELTLTAGTRYTILA